MNLKNIFGKKFDPYSIEGLRKIASDANDVGEPLFYKQLLEIAANQLESSVVTKKEVKEAVTYAVFAKTVKVPATSINLYIKAAEKLKYKFVLNMNQPDKKNGFVFEPVSNASS